MANFSTAQWAETIVGLEKRAGISEAIEDAKLGSYFPNRDATTEEYFDETADYLRRKARKLYFGVEDLELRRMLIHARRQESQAFREGQQAWLVEARKDLAKAKRGSDWKPWLSAAAIAVMCVVLGARYFELYGAIGGAVGGLFVGQAIAASAKREQANEIAIAESDVASAEESVRDGLLSPEWFNAEEESTGERDPNFDDESIVVRRARSRD